MIKYIKAAFGVRQSIPFIGSLPLNLIIVPFFLALSLIHPAFLLIGLSFEALLIWALCSNKRFREMVDSPTLEKIQQDQATQRSELVSKLSTEGKNRYICLQQQIAKTEQNYVEFDTPDYISEPNRRSLDALGWTYLKLLFARFALIGQESEQNAKKVTNDITALQKELSGSNLNEAIRRSKEATLSVLEKRVKHFTKRKESLAQIDADLARIEAEIELAFDNSKLQAKPEEISMDVDFASDTMQSVWFYGDDVDSRIHDIDGDAPPPYQGTTE